MVRSNVEQMRSLQIDSFLEGLNTKGIINDIQKDILSTYKVYMAYPFDRDAAESKIQENNLRYTDMCYRMRRKPGYIPMKLSDMKDDDIRLNLWFQIQELCYVECRMGIV